MAVSACESASFGGAELQPGKNSNKLVNIAEEPDLKNVLAVNMVCTFY